MPRASTAAKKPKVERDVSVVNPRHRIVANAIMEGHSESDALRAAGYNPNNAANVIRHESVQDMLKEARAQVEDLTTIKRLDVLNIFMEAIDMARIQADPANMINGADKVAKMMGYYAPETKLVALTTDQNVLKSKLRALSDDDLYRLAMGEAGMLPE